MSKKPNSVPEKFWPKELIIPSVSEFVHGSWILGLDDGFSIIDKYGNEVGIVDFVGYNPEKLSKASREALRYECHTRCCLVGFAALAFDEPGCMPDKIQNPATAEFLDKFIEFATGKSARQHLGNAGSAADYLDRQFCYSIARLASDIFEGFEASYSDKELSPRRASEIWKKTARHFGYVI